MAAEADARARFELRTQLGGGAMGAVWRAWDRNLRREVAIKRVRADHLAGPQRTLRLRWLLTEGRRLAGVQDDHIVTIHDIVAVDDEVWLVMQLVNGEGLDARIERGVLPVKDAARYGAELAGALQKLHLKGWVHQDVKPANVMVSLAGDRVLLTDFGLVAALDGSSFGGFCGTPGYMAPELLRRASSAGTATDMWAFGATLHELVSGEKPDPFGVVCVPPAARAIGPILTQLLAQEPTARPDAREAQQMLQRVAEGAPPRVGESGVRTVTAVGPGGGGREVNRRDGGFPARTQEPPPDVAPDPPQRPWWATVSGALGLALITVLTAAGVAFALLEPPSHGPLPPAKVSVSPGPTLPAGYAMHTDPAGFAFPLPDPVNGQAWGRNDHGGTLQITYQPGTDEQEIIFGVTPSQSMTPTEHATQLAGQVAQNTSNYQQVRLEGNQFLQGQGVLWEFTFDGQVDSGATEHRHGIEELYRAPNGTEYDIYVVVPDSDWSTGLNRFLAIVKYFRVS